MFDSSICFGGSYCNCIGGRIGDICILTVVGIVVILLLLCCCCCICTLALKDNTPQSKEMPLLLSESDSRSSSKKRRLKKKISYALLAAAALFLACVYYVDFGINLWHVYSVEVSPGLDISAGTYAVDTISERFYAEAGIMDFDVQLWCSNGKVSTKVLGRCLAVNFDCIDLIDTLVPEIPLDAKRTSDRKSVPAMIGSRKCVVYESDDSSWCSINGQIFERCKGSACIKFRNHRRILGLSTFSCE
ncbi:hypothetical protein GEMRC1_007354 [Eukaryota sp. GEM-RC1]